MLQLRELRKNKNMTMKELGAIIGVGESTVSQYENGKRQPDFETLDKLAQYFNVSVDYLLGRIDHNIMHETKANLPDNIIPIKTYPVPLVGTIACGSPILAEENIEEYVRVSEDIQCDFALRCRGDSMINARIFDGDIVYIRQQPTVENGEIAAVLIDNEATLKKVYLYQNRIELRAENPTFKTLEYEGEQLNNIKILGKAVAFFSLVR